MGISILSDVNYKCIDDYKMHGEVLFVKGNTYTGKGKFLLRGEDKKWHYINDKLATKYFEVLGEK